MGSVSEDDWRLQGQERYLLGVTMKRGLWTSKNPSWDHDHCEFCYMKLAATDVPDAENEAYFTEDLNYWVCVDCFADFR